MDSTCPPGTLVEARGCEWVVLGVVIGLGKIANLFFAGRYGAAIPVVMKALGWDPAQCSSIILTTVADVVGFIAFLGLAGLFPSYLIQETVRVIGSGLTKGYDRPSKP